MGDFNGDSTRTLAIANALSNDVSVLLGGAGGSFGGPTLPAGTTPFQSRSATSTPTPTPTSVANNSHNVSVLLNRMGVGACAGGAPTIVGTASPETLRGTDDDDVIAGLGGEDTVVGSRAMTRFAAGAATT